MTTQTTTTAGFMTSSFSEDTNPHSERGVTTWTVQWDKGAGYQIDTSDPEATTNVKANIPPQAIIPPTAPDPVVPVAGQWWCVVDESGLGTIYGPYLTEAAAQSLIDDGKATGNVVSMELA